jgi:serine/threonine protein kinase
MYLLTYEKLPFDPLPSEEVDGDVNNIIIFNISTKEPIFNYETKSELANNLLKKLLEKSPRKRLSAKHALQDPFFNTLYNTCLLSK